MRHTRGRPCNSPAKHPHGKLAPNGLCSATTDAGTIKLWFGLAAPTANLGVITDKLVVIDIDPRHDGSESLAAVEHQYGELPHTWRALTGGGGEHIIFAAPEGIAVPSFAAGQMSDPPLGPGIDLRAKGGYIVAPPSHHICGRSYNWSVDHHPSETELAPPPDWLIEKVIRRGRNSDSESAARPVPPSAEWAKLVTGPITEYRDMAAARLAGHLFRRWVDVDVVITLMQDWNLKHCVPPLTDSELLRILNRIADKEAARLERKTSR
jgi:hypothetical protein